MSSPLVLIVEDEHDIRQMLAFSLAKEGFQVLETADGNKAVRLAGDKRPDVILLDIMIPGLDGLGVCKALQRNPDTADIPVIMLTAKGEEVDRIVGFELGAADYVVKPFSLREIALRIRAVLKRGATTDTQSALRCGDIRLDPVSHTVHAGDRLVELTITEFRVLQDLLTHTGQVRSREQLLDSAWGYSFEGYARGVDSHIKRLRAKLDEAGDCIETVRGIGYRARSFS